MGLVESDEEDLSKEKSPSAVDGAAEDKAVSEADFVAERQSDEETSQAVAKGKGRLDHLAKVLEELNGEVGLAGLVNQPSEEPQPPKAKITISSDEEETPNPKKRKKNTTAATRTSKRTKKVVKIEETPKVQVIQERKPRTKNLVKVEEPPKVQDSRWKDNSQSIGRLCWMQKKGG